MKKILSLLLLSAVIVTASAQVQRKKTVVTDTAVAAMNKPADGKDGRRDMMKELNLTKLQKHKLKEMRQSAKAKMDEIQNDTKLSDEAKKGKLKEVRRQQMESTLSVLTDEQKTKFKQMQKDKQQQKKGTMEMEEQ